MAGIKDFDFDFAKELLDKAQKEEKEKALPKVKKHLFRFINDYNVQEGVDKIPNYLIYHTYKVKWDKYKNDYKMTKIEFFRQFNKLFTSYRLGKQRYYLLNKDSFDMSRENIMDAEFYDKKYQRKKKKAKKVKSQIPEPGSKI